MHSAALRDDQSDHPGDGRNPLYYLDNFQRVLAWIADRYACLLDAREADFIHRFGALPCPARAPLVRMIMRKGTLFRASKLHYEEIGCPIAAASQLPADWLATDPALDIDGCSPSARARKWRWPSPCWPAPTAAARATNWPRCARPAAARAPFPPGWASTPNRSTRCWCRTCATACA